MNQRDSRNCGACGPLTTNSKHTFIHLDQLPNHCRYCGRADCLSTSSSKIFPRHVSNHRTTGLKMAVTVRNASWGGLFKQNRIYLSTRFRLWTSAKRLFMFCEINMSLPIAWQQQMIWFNYETAWKLNLLSHWSRSYRLPWPCELPFNLPRPTWKVL